MTEPKMEMPKLIETIVVRHRVAWDEGPQIWRIERIQLPDGSIVEVNFWYENGKLLYIR